MEQLLDITEIEKRQLNYATFGVRFAAMLIDGVILIVVQNVVKYFFGYGYNDDDAFLILSSIIFYWLYFAGMESSGNQATLGKLAVGIQVGKENGERISFTAATIRHFGKFISAVILGFGYLMMIWDEKKQTLHDKMARTFVFSKK